MKQLQPELANQFVKHFGFRDIYDTEKRIRIKDVENALKNIKTEEIEILKKTYKNDVKQKIDKGIKTKRDLLTLTRRILRRHNVAITYKRSKDINGVLGFEYKLVR